MLAERIGTPCPCTSRDNAPRYSSESAARCSPRCQSARAAAPMSSGRLSRRMSSEPTCVGGAPFSALPPSCPLSQSRSRGSTQTSAAAPISHSATRRPADRFLNISTHQRKSSGFSSFFSGASSLDFLKRRTFFFSSPAHSGSARTSPSAIQTASASIADAATLTGTGATPGPAADAAGASVAGAEAAGCAWTAPHASITAASSRSRERTAELLLDVPGLEDHAPVQVHGESRRDVERLQEQHDQRVGRRDRDVQPHLTGRVRPGWKNQSHTPALRFSGANHQTSAISA